MNLLRQELSLHSEILHDWKNTSYSDRAVCTT